MNDILEMIEDLEMLDALDPVGKEAHIERLLKKYRDRLADFEAFMEAQYEMEGI